MQHDPLADMLIAIKNAAMVGKREVLVPYSRLKHAIAQKLFQAGYLAGVTLRGQGPQKRIVATIKYLRPRRPYERPQSVLRGIQRVSKPSRRVYRGARGALHPKRGTGTFILTTPRGVLLAEEARREGVGGEVLVAVW